MAHCLVCSCSLEIPLLKTLITMQKAQSDFVFTSFVVNADFPITAGVNLTKQCKNCCWLQIAHTLLFSVSSTENKQSSNRHQLHQRQDYHTHMFSFTQLFHAPSLIPLTSECNQIKMSYRVLNSFRSSTINAQFLQYKYRTSASRVSYVRG